ncbi:MAG: putative Ig domain-containing protein [Candidatus Sumerlaeota bacterium]|nr:putative Ig domain-containing protein [Candidatus Sumerlaeota bacterium]
MAFYYGASIPELGITGYAGYQLDRLRNNALDSDGGTGRIFLGKNTDEEVDRALLRFDLSALSSGWTVTGDATLSFGVTAVVAASDWSTHFFDVYVVGPNNATWAPSLCSWNYLVFGTANDGLGTPWKDSAGVDLPLATSTTSGGGGLGDPGQGYGATAIATVNKSAWAVGDTFVATIPLAAVQGQIADGATPRGFLIRQRDETNGVFGRLQFNTRTSGQGGGTLTIQAEPAAANHPPSFNADPFSKPDATVGQAYSQSIASDASDPDPGDTLTFAKVSGPAWLSVASNGALTGTPSAGDVGLNVFPVSVTDGIIPAPVTATMNITVGTTQPPSAAKTWTRY